MVALRFSRKRGPRGSPPSNRVATPDGADGSPVDPAMELFFCLRRMKQRLNVLAAVGITAWLVSGCASGVQNPSGVPVTVLKPDEQGFIAGSGIESQDLVAVTDKMARSLLGTPEIQNFAPHSPVGRKRRFSPTAS